MITVNEINYLNFGKCVAISNGAIEIYVTVDFGPRIIRCGFVGGENFMLEDRDFSLKMSVADSEFDDDTFYIRGGHRCWISPERAPRVRYPDNKRVSYEHIGSKVIFYQEKQEANEVEISLEIEMSENANEIIINHIVKNTSYWPKEYAVWPITVLNGGGLAYIPMNIVRRGLLPNRNIVFWPYAKITDERAVFGDRYISLRHDSSVEGAFKVGINQERPWAVYFHHGDMFLKKYLVIDGGKYTDFGSTFEAYTDSNVLELESLGELKTVDSGETNSHIEKWILYKDVTVPVNEDEMDKIKDKYNLEEV